MFRVIPVIDLLRGQAVRAIAGNRRHYQPVSSRLHPGSDPFGLALAVRDQLGLKELYLADLDAIAGLAPSWSLYRSLIDAGLCLWLDAGVMTAHDASALLRAGVNRVILGSETLRGPEVLAEILAEFGPERLVFSLDLRSGVPWLAEGANWGSNDAGSIVSRALELGIRRLLVLDVARVGLGGGAGTEALVSMLRAIDPAIEIVAGGGISGRGDLISLATAGASAVLVGSAIMDGRIGPGDWS